MDRLNSISSAELSLGNIASERQVKSKSRVTDHGEVFTRDEQVNDMLDLVIDETERIESRFLEPACGEGAFLAEVLRRKLNQVKNRYSKKRSDLMRYAILALSSIYGIDKLLDNIQTCRKRLLSIWVEELNSLKHFRCDLDLVVTANFILGKNILDGDALTLKRLDGSSIVFSEWSFISEELIKRRDFKFEDLLSAEDEQLSLFQQEDVIGEDSKYSLPMPIREFEPVDYRTMAYAE